VTEEQVFSYLRSFIPSLWALDVLLLLRRNAERVWCFDELVLELRSSRTAVEHSSASLIAAGMIAEEKGGLIYRPATYELRRFGEELERIYATRPASVVNAIMTAPNESLRIFSDAFRVKY
jgi:hypothetical protein